MKQPLPLTRINSIVGADQIVVVDDGRIVDAGKHQGKIREAGSYQRLLSQNGLYAKLWSTQHKSLDWNIRGRASKSVEGKA